MAVLKDLTPKGGGLYLFGKSTGCHCHFNLFQQDLKYCLNICPFKFF